jgi:hypothetical protein
MMRIGLLGKVSAMTTPKLEKDKKRLRNICDIFL